MGSWITIEISGGCTIERASEDAQRVANLLSIDVKFSFNDVRCIAVPQGSSALLAERQQEEQARKLAFPRDRKFATSDIRPRYSNEDYQAPGADHVG